MASAQQTINDLWWHGNEKKWSDRREVYWSFIRPELRGLEREMERLDAAAVRRMDQDEWYQFLLQKYFRWKYTAPNRYATTTRQLAKYVETGTLDALHRIKSELFATAPRDIARQLTIVTQIRGLGTAGASGLLSLLFPSEFGSVDQFVVKALLQTKGLAQAGRLLKLNPVGLTTDDGVLLIGILREKAAELNRQFGTGSWTPRGVDMVLWTYGR